MQFSGWTAALALGGALAFGCATGGANPVERTETDSPRAEEERPPARIGYPGDEEIPRDLGRQLVFPLWPRAPRRA